MDINDGTKTFKDLVKEVHEPGLCGSCGGCVSFCSAGELMAIGFGVDGRPKLLDEESCLECGICYMICPQIDILDKDLIDTYQWKSPIGQFKRIVAARSTNPGILKNATDGGVVSSILHCLLDKKIIDGAVVSKKTAQFAREPMIATSYEEVLSAAGSRFTGICGVEELSRFSTYSPTMFAIKEVANMDLIKIVVVGTPCQVHTLRKMQSLHVVPSHVVKFVFGLFCTESYSFDVSKKGEMEKILGISFDDIEKMNIREDFIIKLKNGETKHIPLEKMEDFVRSACLACSDFANDFADLSFGGLGSPEGWTTVLIRTDLGEAIYLDAIHHGFIEEFDKSQGESHNYTQERLGKITEFAKMKRNRALKNKNVDGNGK
ncbi:MAG: Coenzyme F420 hydrogenase/dehydrogenase, beta subunit C-terminal domain [Methanomassiliicoccales archaeon]|nr:MAG: Coenzyme F420 hydrogenase/dehydrogenase, beta subunit C-terminal domain [Methanomassiliicoccales archaeon]